MASTYSFGEDSPLKFHISDKMADYYNQAVEQYFKAQVRFNQKFGRKWDPSTDPIEISWSKKQRKAWNAFAKVFESVVKDQGPYHANDIMDDFLIKNTVSAVSVVSDRWGTVITLSAALGALYGYLRGL